MSKKKKKNIQKSDFDENQISSSNSAEIDFSNPRIRGLLPLLLSLILLAFLWSETGVKVVNPWTQAIKMLDSAKKVDDKEQKKEIINRAGIKLIELTNKHPYHARLHYYLSYYYLLTKQWDSSIVHGFIAVKKDSGSLWNQVGPGAMNNIKIASTNLAKKYIDDRDFENAKIYYLQAYKYAPDDKQILNSLGKLYVTMGKMDSAYYFYNKYMKYDSVNPEVFNNIGVILIKQNKKKEAIAYFEKAFRLRPENFNFQRNYEAIKKEVEKEGK